VTEASETSPPLDRSAQAASVLREILRLADLPATLEVKDGVDGGISIALALGTELPGVAVGRRGTFVDALQFLVNKLTHRPGSERRWVSLGLGEHPAPRIQRPLRAAQAQEANGGHRQAVSVRAPQAVVAAAEPIAVPAPRVFHEEAVVEVAEDAALSHAARAMASASALTGRFYGVVTLSADDRSRILRAVKDVPGVRVSVEGEGRLRRLVFTPDHPVPMPKKTHPLGVDVDETAGGDGSVG
jgi:predicted RNA-binding protein Jag